MTDFAEPEKRRARQGRTPPGERHCERHGITCVVRMATGPEPSSQSRWNRSLVIKRLYRAPVPGVCTGRL